jgi:hypothetical protein
MAFQIRGGPTKWSATRDRDGQREYKITFRVFTNNPQDGPALAMQTPGLPIVGDFWIVGNDVDLWATCKLDTVVKPILDGEPNTQFDVEFTFSTKGDAKRCKDQQIDDPLLQPYKLSGTFVHFTEEGIVDRFGKRIWTSSFEPFMGHLNEWDASRPTVSFEANVAVLPLALINQMQDTVNDQPLWGFPARSIKFKCPKWERKFYGLCAVYYTVTYEFEIRIDKLNPANGGFDRTFADVGTMVLNGQWNQTTGQYEPLAIEGYTPPSGQDNPNPLDPSHFIKYVDRVGNPGKVVLDGRGLPAGQALDFFGTLYVSIAVDANGENFGHPVDSLLWWLPLNSTSPTPWLPTVQYKMGDPVIALTLAGVCIAATDNVDSNPDDGPNPDWANVPSIQDKGDWDPEIVYRLGDYVLGPDQGVSDPGGIQVQYYNQSNFLLLGIPTTVP